MSAVAQIIPRPSEERGHADHGWLKSFHTFSFAGYQDRRHSEFGALRVINEDRVAPSKGFDTHAHREFEIFSYIVNGALEHKDSMGNIEILKRGDIQMTSAGTGIAHSEHTHGSKEVHFLQIWARPSQSRLPPKYYTRHFSDAAKTNKWVRVVAPVGDDGVSEEREVSGPAPVHSPLSLYATIVEAGKTVAQPLTGRKAYIHVVQTSGYNTGKAAGAKVKVTLGDSTHTFQEGDGAYMSVPAGGLALSVENVGAGSAEVLLFDIE